MESVLKIDLKLAESDARILDGQSRILNWLYNHLLEISLAKRAKFQQTGCKESGSIVYSKRGLRNLIPKLKNDHAFLKSVHSSPLKNAALRLSESIGAHRKSRKKIRKGKKTGWPRYRKWSENYFSLLYDEPKKGFKINGRSLTISLGVGSEGKRIKIQCQLSKSPFSFENVEIRNLRITKELGKYYAIFTIKREEPSKKTINRVIAIDPNHKNLGYGVCDDGSAIEIANPWFIKERQRRIDLLKRRRDKCLKKSVKIEKDDGKFYWKPSRRWSYFDRILEKEYRKRREQTKTFLYSISHCLCKNYDYIAIGDYTPNGSGKTKAMRRSMNNESLIGRFKLTMNWVARKSGKWFEEWCEKGSTRTCSECETVVVGGIAPNIREWDCCKCKRHHIRDENAAINGLAQILKKNTFPGSGHLPLEIMERWALRFDGLGFSRSNRGLS